MLFYDADLTLRHSLIPEENIYPILHSDEEKM